MANGTARSQDALLVTSAGTDITWYFDASGEANRDPSTRKTINYQVYETRYRMVFPGNLSGEFPCVPSAPGNRQLWLPFLRTAKTHALHSIYREATHRRPTLDGRYLESAREGAAA